MDEAKTVHGPVWYPGLGWEVRLYFESEEAARGFAAFATAGFKARQDVGAPTLLWVPASGADPAGPLPPQPLVLIHAIDTRGTDQVIKIHYSAVGVG
jgi:hypothetical protein